MRRAPIGGYDVASKRQYRRDVWAFFAKHSPVPMAEAQAFLMPSTEGDEIEVALSKGCREYNLHVCDRNPAIVATLKRRFPRIKTYGVEVARAAGRIPTELHLANVDLCSPITAEAIRTTRAIARRLHPWGLLAYTFLRGRDVAVAVQERISQPREMQASDMLALQPLWRGGASPFRVGRYRSAHSPMGWVAGATSFARTPSERELAARGPISPEYVEATRKLIDAERNTAEVLLEAMIDCSARLAAEFGEQCNVGWR